MQIYKLLIIQVEGVAVAVLRGSTQIPKQVLDPQVITNKR